MNRINQSQLLSWVKKQAAIVAVLLVLLSCGLAPFLVQIVGWVTMVPQHWQETGSLSVALEQTFDGKHPCSFCLAAEKLMELEAVAPEEKSSDKNSLQSKDKGKDLLSFQSRKVRLNDLSPHLWMGDKDLFQHSLLGGGPPTPPPQKS